MNTTLDPPEVATALRSFTVAEVMAWGPCYDEARVRSLFAGRKRLTALDALDLDIPAKDRLWIATCPGTTPDAILHEFACRVAIVALDSVEAAGGKVDPRSRAAIAAKRAWVRGEIDNAALSAALSAAYSAADSAPDSAAGSAALRVALSAAYSAALSAAYSAALSAADSAAYSAALSAANRAAYNTAYRAANRAAWEANIQILRSLIVPDQKGFSIP